MSMAINVQNLDLVNQSDFTVHSTVWETWTGYMYLSTKEIPESRKEISILTTFMSLHCYT